MNKWNWLITLSACLSLLAGCAVPTTVPTSIPTESSATPVPTETLTPTPIPPTETPTELALMTPTSRIVHMSRPSEPPERFDSQIIDMDSSAYARSKKVAGGDNFDIGQYERPFNSGSMDTYSPDLDILEARLSQSGDWVYVTIMLAGTPRGTLLSDSYGVELDLNADGRGDFLVIASKPGVVWSVDGVSVWYDANHDVGGSIPIKADLAVSGDGYEEEIFNSGKGADTDAAWARVNPNDFSSIQIAFNKALIDHDKAYLWNVWAEDVISPGLFDYNDHMTLADAGSPIPAQGQAYPLKGLANVDNTCRWAVGFNPTGAEPGLCPQTISQSPNSSESYIHGLVWYDRNSNLLQDPGEPGFENLTINLTEGACGSGGKIMTTTQTALNGTYEIRGVAAGTYCLAVGGEIPPGTVPVKGSGPQTILLKTGQEVKVNFPFVLGNP